jgi:hypothetical protein
LRRRNRPEKLIFVGGAPRSGTTVTHALLCTAPGFSPFHPEIAFFRGIVGGYRIGADAWEENTSAFFRDRTEFRNMVRETGELWLDKVWQTVGCPSVLCMKEPHLTPFFPDLSDLFPDALFITVCRHPYDVVRSRQDVYLKAGEHFDQGRALQVAREYAVTYERVLNHSFSGRHVLFRYEDLNTDRVRQTLARFLDVPGFDTSKMWRTATGEPIAANENSDPWISPKNNGPIDLGRRLEPLAPEFQVLVRRICEPVMARLQYG